jgi:hypothetical protein
MMGALQTTRHNREAAGCEAVAPTPYGDAQQKEFGHNSILYLLQTHSTPQHSSRVVCQLYPFMTHGGLQAAAAKLAMAAFSHMLACNGSRAEAQLQDAMQHGLGVTLPGVFDI